MKEYQFLLNDMLIEEPQGFADIVQGMRRDPKFHGTMFEASVNELGFYGDAAEFLINQKNTFGLKASVIFTANERCSELEDFALVIKGRLNFGKFKSWCGIECRVSMPIEQEDCVMTLRNRFDQQVDLDSNLAFDKMTVLGDYAGLGFEMELAAQEFDVGVVGEVGDKVIDTYTAQMSPMAANAIYAWITNFRPSYHNGEISSIAQGSLVPDSFIGTRQYDRTFRTLYEDFFTPQLLFDDNVKCFGGQFAPEVNARLKGVVEIHSDSDDYKLVVTVYFVKYQPGNPDMQFPTWDTDSDITATQVLQKHVLRDQSTNNPSDITIPFDFTYTKPALPFAEGESFNAYVSVYAQVNDEPPENMTATVTFDPETSIDISTVRVCPPTNAEVYLVNEALSRATEAITNNCVKVKSDYYGRTDSQPYASENDGCGALRVLTRGLKLRNAEGGMFIALESLINDLSAIDNIGFGFEANPNLPGFNWMRVEQANYFYQDVEVARFPFVPTVQSEVDEGGHYSLIKVGYTKWEPKAVGGLDEFNSTREYRTSLETVKQTLEITSNLIAAGYVIETTRQQSFVETGAADTTYDNDNFIICVERQAYGYVVEQGNISEPENIFSPHTAYNFRISPFRNLMRWFKSVVNGYANIIDPSSKLFFSQGTGNYTARGRRVGSCILENGPKSENQDLSINDFLNTQDALPLYRPENVTFTHPFTRADWEAIRANPSGYVSVQCGNGDWLKGYVTELQWKVKDGTAEIKLKLKY